MDHRPRAETVRLLAAAAYVPPVALVLLMRRKTRAIRLLRFHAYQAIGLGFWLVLMLLLGSAASTLLGGLPALGFWVNVLVGVSYLALFVATVSIWFYAAVMAYQGNYTRIPLLADWVWARVNDQQAAPVRKKRVRRRLARPEEAEE